MNLSAIDLNLLTAFDAIMAERNVSRAAVRLGITQPAMSNALARLRAILGDELFVRTPREMRPTPRAIELAEPICDALQQLRFALDRPKSFDPGSSTRIFALAASDNCDFALAPAIARLRRLAPGIGIEIIGSKRAAALDRLDEGTFDLAIGRLVRLPQRYFSAALYEERSVCIFNHNVHKLANGLTLELFAAYPHLRVEHDTLEFIDTQLGEHGLARHVAVTVPNFAVVPYALENSDLIAIVGERIARRFAALPWIGICELPLIQEPWTISTVWGKGQDSDRGTVWLREELRQACAEV